MPTYVKDPDAVLDYGFDWSAWLAAGETIATSTWTVPVGLTNESESNTDTLSVVWLSGGTDRQTYQVVNHIVTSQGREDDRTLKIKIKDR